MARHLKLLLLLSLWVMLVTGFSIAAPAILQADMATSVLQVATILALVALGQAFVVLGGGAGIDVSVGGIVSLTGILAMAIAGHVAGGGLIPVACVLIGGMLGALNGILVTWVRLPPLIATLGTFYAFGGAAMAITAGASISGVPDWLVPLGRGTIIGVPIGFALLVLPAYGIGAVVLGYSPLGRWIYALGCNENATRLVGINVSLVRFGLYCFSGMTAGLASLAAMSWFGSARPNIGVNLELDSLAAILVGGISIVGGRGRLGSVLVAVILVVTLKSGLQFVNLNIMWQLGIVGALVLLAMLADRVDTRAAT